MYIWFVFFLADCSLISMLWNFLQFPLWWRSTVCMYVALQKQFNLCTQYIYTVCVLYMLMHSQICSFKSVIALCSLNFVWIMQSNFISLCLWGSLIQAVTPHESLLLTIACERPTKWSLQWSCCYNGNKNSERAHEKSLNLCWLSIIL